MPKYEVSITITLPKRPKSEKIKSNIVAKDAASAAASMIGGVFADPSRKGSVIWYRDFHDRTLSRGYYRSEKRILISAVRQDLDDIFNDSLEFATVGGGKISIKKLPDEIHIKKPPKEPDKQLSLFGSIVAFGNRYIQVSAKDDEGTGVPYGKEDKVELQELARGKPKTPSEYAIFWRVYSPQAYKLLESLKSATQSPIESDQWQQFVSKLRDADAWILSNQPTAAKTPPMQS